MGRRIQLSATSKLLATTCLFSAVWASGSLSADAQTILETVRTAIAENPEISVVTSDRRAVDQELRQARAGYLPSIDAQGSVGPEYTQVRGNRRDSRSGQNSRWLARSEARITLSQMLFDGFETQSEVERQRARVDSAAYRVEESSEFIALDSIEAHLDILRNQEIVRLNERNVEQHELILSQVRELEQSGRGDIADLRQAQSRLARAKDNLAQSEGSLADAFAAYQRLVGNRPGELDRGVPPVAALPPSPEDAANLASTNSPTVMIAAADVDASSAELRGSKSGYLPRLDLEVGSGVVDDANGLKGSEVDASALLVLRYNLYRGGADIALERESFHRLNEARANLRDSRWAAEQEARFSFNALNTARQQVAIGKNKVEAQRRTRDAYASQFDIGQRQLLDLLDAENELFIDRVSLVTAEFTQDFAVYRVLAVVGELLNTLEVSAPREHISIERKLDDVQTPETIRRKSEELVDPRAEPQILTDPAAGAPPADGEDIAPFVGSSNATIEDDEADQSSLQEETGVSYASLQPDLVGIPEFATDEISYAQLEKLNDAMIESALNLPALTEDQNETGGVVTVAADNDAVEEPSWLDGLWEKFRPIRP